MKKQTMKLNKAVQNQNGDATPIPPEQKRQTPATIANFMAVIFLINSTETYGIILNDVPKDIPRNAESCKPPEFKSQIQLNNYSNESFTYNEINQHSTHKMTPRNESLNQLSALHNLYFPVQKYNVSLINNSTIIDGILRNCSQKVRKNSEKPIIIRRMNFIERTSAKLTSESFLTEYLNIQNTSLCYNNNHGYTESQSEKLPNAKPLECKRDRFLSNSRSSIFINCTSDSSSITTTNLSTKKQVIILNSKKKRELFQNDYLTPSIQKVKKLRHSNNFKIQDAKQKSIKINKGNNNPLLKKTNKIIDKVKFLNLRKIIEKINKNKDLTSDARIAQTKSQNFHSLDNSFVNGEKNYKTLGFNELASNETIKTINDSLNRKESRIYETREDQQTNITNHSLTYSRTLPRSTLFDSNLIRSKANKVMSHGKEARNKTLFNFLFQLEYITTNKMVMSSDKFTINKKNVNKVFAVDNLFERNYEDLDHVDVILPRTTPFFKNNPVRDDKSGIKREEENSTLSERFNLMNDNYFDDYLDFDSLYQENVDVNSAKINVVTDVYIDKNNDRGNIYRHYDTFLNCSNLADNFLLIKFYSTVDPCRTTFSTTPNDTISNATTTTHKVSNYVIEHKFFSYDVVFATVILGLGMLLITTAICCCCINMMLS